ncbi:MAG: hypothetical protein AB1730_22845 [Myxococcota bacterium]
MNWPVVFGLCENDLQRDQEFLRAYAEVDQVDLKLVPLSGPVLTDGAARLLSRRLAAAANAGVEIAAVLLHTDADTVGAAKRRKQAQQWAQRLGFKVPVIVCCPDPCLERWLCRCQDLKGASAPAASPCDGWKKGWSRSKGVDLDRVRSAARIARAALRGLPDFDEFHANWRDVLKTSS